MRLWRFSNVFNQADHVEREAIGRNHPNRDSS